MNLLESFKVFLFSQQNKPSGVTVKNYLSDINHFIRWSEKVNNKPFSPEDLKPQTIADYKNQNSDAFSASSLERHLSSLRKFVFFLKSEGKIVTSPFEIENSAVKNRLDPWKLKEFKNFLFTDNASHLTIKNYLIDIKQFLSWSQEVISGTDVKENPLDNLSSDLIEEYKNRLITQTNFSPATVNRKLSSLRKYLDWAQSQDLINRLDHHISNIEDREIISNQEVGLPEMANSLQTTDYSSPNAVVQTPSYSSFPPLRLFQKISKGIFIALDILVIFKLVSLIESANLILWQKKGKPIFETNQSTARVKEFSHIDLLGIKNLPKESYAPLKVSTKFLPWYKKAWIQIKYNRPNWYKRYHSYAIVHYFHFAILIIFMASLAFGFYNSFIQKTNENPTLAAAPTAPPRILSFQGRLTDNNDNPITSTTLLRFGIYDSSSASGSALLWEEQVGVTPDTDGIFNSILGNVNAIPQSLFAQNSALWLGVTVGATAELTPRQQLATVAFATNAEVLQGLPPITDISNGTLTSNTVLALDSSGNLTIGGSANPVFQASGGQFKLSGQPLLLTTNTGSGSNIQVAPDGLGKIDLQKPLFNSTNNNNLTTARGAVEVNDLFAVLATSSGQSAFTLNQDSTGPLISASASGASKFTVGNNGEITSANYINNGGMLYTTIAGLIGQTTVGSTGQCLQSIGGGTPTWGTCGSGSGNSPFAESLGAIIPNNSTEDLLIGGQSTSAAKFRFINVASGTPIASISANSGNIATYLTGDGTLATTNRQNLTIGNSSTYNTTGNILLNPNGTGNVGIGQVSPTAKLHIGTSDGDLRLGDVTAGTSSTDVGLMMNGNGSFESALFTEVDGGILSYGINVPQITTRNTSRSGGIFRFDTRTGGADLNGDSHAFVIKRYANGSSTEVNALIIDLDSGNAHLAGNVGIGSTAPDAKLEINHASGDNLRLTYNDADGSATNFTDFSLASDGDLTIDSNGGNITLADTLTLSSYAADANAVLYTTTGGVVTRVAETETASQCLLSGSGTSGIPTWGTCGSGSGNSPFSESLGAIIPNNSTVDLLVGGQSTASADFAVLNVAKNQAVATVSGQLIVMPNNGWGGQVGIGTTNPAAKLDTLSTTEQLRLSYNASNYSSFTTSSGGDLTVAPSGGDTAITGNLDVSSHMALGSSASIFARSTLSIEETLNPVTDEHYHVVRSRAHSDAPFTGSTPPILWAGSFRAESENPSGVQDAFGGVEASFIANTQFGGTITTAQGLFAYSQNQGTGTITNNYGARVASAINSGGGTITTNYGLHISTQTAGTSDYGARIDAADTQTLWISGNANNTTAAAGIAFGSSRDTNLYRSAANTLKTDDSFSVGTNLTVAGTITFSTLTSNGGVLYTNGSGVLAQATAGTASQCLLGGTSPSFGACSTGGDAFWDQSNGALYPNNSSVDLLVGGQSTTSAKFAITNVAGARGTQTASLSGSLTLDSSTASVQTTNNQLLTVGGNSTGDIQFKPGNSSTSLYLQSTGNVGIGTTSPGYKLEVNGTVAFPNLTQVSSGTLTDICLNSSNVAVESSTNSCNVSSLRFKKNVATLTPGTGSDILNQLRPVSFEYKDGDIPHYGFIAEDIDQVDKTLVAYDAQGLPFSLDFNGITAVLTQVQQDMAHRIDIRQASSSNPSILSLYQGASGPALLINANGNVGIGTTSPNFHLDVQDSLSATAATQVYNTNAGTDADGLIVKLGNSSTTTVASTNHFISFETAGIGIVGSIQGNGGKNINYKSNGIADFAEYMDKDPNLNIEWGSVLCQNQSGNVYPCASNSSNAIGVASEFPSFTGGIDKGNGSITVGLSGVVSTRVSNQKGDIKSGDYITYSNTSGVGVKAIKVGQIIGIAMSDYNSSNEGKIYVTVNPSWYDPDVQLTSTGNLNISDNTPFMSFDAPHTYTLSTPFGLPVDRIGAFAELAVSKLKAGFISAQQVSTNTLSVATENITIGGQSIRSYIASVVTDILNNDVLSPVSSSDVIHTNIISPLGDGKIAIKVDKDKISILNGNSASSSAVTSFDNKGNATFSGQLSANSLQSNNATIGGTLRAKRILADEIVLPESLRESLRAGGLNATSSSNYITNITNIYNSTPSGGNHDNFGLIANNGQQNTTNNTPNTNGFADIASYSGQLSNVGNLANSNGSFGQGLMVFGPTSLSDTSVVGQLSVNGSLILSTNSINTLGSDLNLQPLRQGGLSIMAGLIYIDTNGNVKIKGDVQIEGTLFANTLSPIPGHDLAINLGNQSANSKLIVENSSKSAILTINSLGDLVASGTGTFSKLNLSIAKPAFALSSTEVIATGSAGVASIQLHKTELTIDNKLVTDKSLIYITPASSTGNQVIFLLRQVPGISFTVGVEDPAIKDIPFNWIIVN